MKPKVFKFSMAKRLVLNHRRYLVVGLGVGVVVGSDRVLGCDSGLRVFVPSRPIRLEEGIDGGIAWLVHAEAVFVLKPHHEGRCAAFHVYLRFLKNMLITVSVFMHHCRYHEKFALVWTVFNSRETLQRSVIILRQEHDETQRMV